MKLPQLSPQAWLTLQLVFSQGFGLLLFAVQAPLLGPTAFGLIAIVMVFIGFCEQVLEVASSEALISVKTIDGWHYRTMTTINGLIGLSIGVTVFVAAEPIARLFAEPELAEVLRVMCVLPMISALSSAPSAAAHRDMQFKPLAIRGIASVGGGGVVGIVLALMGYGVWALVWQAIVQRALAVVVMWMAVQIPFQIGISTRHFRELWQYGGPMLIAETTAWATSQTPRFVLGLFFGPAEVGLFALGARLNEMLIHLTLHPPFSVARIEMRRFVDDAQGLEQAVRDLLQRMAVLCFPLAIGSAVVTPLLFEIWLDDRWSGAATLTRILLISSMPYVVHYALSAALLGMNRQSAIAANSTVQGITTVISIVISAPFGLIATVATFGIRPLLTAPIPMHYLRRDAGMPFAVVSSALAPILAAAVLMGLILLALAATVDAFLPQPAVLMLPVLTVTGIGVYGLLLSVLAPECLRVLLQRFRPRD